MPAYPQLKCAWCKTPFPRPASKGTNPRTCTEECRRALRADENAAGPRCDRCGERFRRKHIAERYCAKCKGGCLICGGKVEPKVKLKGSPRPARLTPIYCKPECLAEAWKDTPLPVCTMCGLPVPLPKPPRTLRNPPKIHDKCRLKPAKAPTKKAKK